MLDAQRVIDKKHLKFKGCKLTISEFVPEPTVQVSGVSDKISPLALDLFFESTKKSGGGEIKDVQLVPSRQMAIITFRDQLGK